MSSCTHCGGDIIFRHTDRGIIPIHLSGGCSGPVSRPRSSSGRSSINYYADYYADYRWGVAQSYREPNSSCPACGTAVFFYQSPYGGRLYFDALGPPWPRHPCTDNPTFRTAASHAPACVPRVNNPQVRQHPAVERATILESGWLPFIFENAESVANTLVVRGHLLSLEKRREIAATAPLRDTRYYERTEAGVLIGINLMMNAGRFIDALREGLTMMRFKSETDFELDVVFMTLLHEPKRILFESR